MKNWKMILKEFGYFLLSIIGIVLVMGTFSYLISIPSIVITILLLISVIMVFLIFGYRAGRRRTSKGYVAGIIVGIVGVLIMGIVSIIIFGFKWPLSKLIYYAVLILTSTIGSMIGINKK